MWCRVCICRKTETAKNHFNGKEDIEEIRRKQKMKIEELNTLLDIDPPRIVRPYKVVNGCVFLLCPDCRAWKAPEDFSVDNKLTKFFRRRAECKECQSLNNKEYLKKNPNKVKEFAKRQKEKKSIPTIYQSQLIN